MKNDRQKSYFTLGLLPIIMVLLLSSTAYAGFTNFKINIINLSDLEMEVSCLEEKNSKFTLKYGENNILDTSTYNSLSGISANSKTINILYKDIKFGQEIKQSIQLIDGDAAKTPSVVTIDKEHIPGGKSILGIKQSALLFTVSTTTEISSEKSSTPTIGTMLSLPKGLKEFVDNVLGKTILKDFNKMTNLNDTLGITSNKKVTTSILILPSVQTDFKVKNNTNEKVSIHTFKDTEFEVPVFELFGLDNLDDKERDFYTAERGYVLTLDPKSRSAKKRLLSGYTYLEANEQSSFPVMLLALKGDEEKKIAPTPVYLKNDKESGFTDYTLQIGDMFALKKINDELLYLRGGEPLPSTQKFLDKLKNLKDGSSRFKIERDSNGVQVIYINE